LAVAEWIESLPLLDVAKSWELSVEAFNGGRCTSLGRYKWNAGIARGVKSLSTWSHELVHAADYRNGSLKELGQHWRSETVAELGGAVLLHVLGGEHDADLGVLDACKKVLKRTCDAVALVLDTAEQLVALEAGEPACV
jgi:hypothetical protein